MDVGQFVYSRVEKHESPRKVGGFQIVAFTPARIREAVLEEAERQIEFDAGSEQESQLQFYQLADQRVVIARLQKIAERDQCGRGGNFMTHGLVLSREEFRSAGSNPIKIAETLFREDGNDIRRVAIEANGMLPTYELRIASQSRLDVRSRWSGCELRKLIRVAVDSVVAKEGPVCGIRGPMPSKCETLQLVFDLIPLELREQLSFRTHSTRMDRNGPCIQGVCSAKRDWHDCVIDTESVSVKHYVGPMAAFSRWLNSTHQVGTVRDLDVHGKHAWKLHQLLDGTIAGTPECREQSEREFWAANESACRRKLLQVCERRFGTALANRAIGQLLAVGNPSSLFQNIAGNWDDDAFANGVHAAYCRCAAKPKTGELEELESLATRLNDTSLQVWLFIWTGETKRLEGVVRQLEAGKLFEIDSYVRESTLTREKVKLAIRAEIAWRRSGGQHRRQPKKRWWSLG